MAPNGHGLFTRKRVLSLWLLVCLGIALALLFPVRFGLLRAALLTGATVAWAGSIWLFWGLRPVRFGLLTATTGIGVAPYFSLPARWMPIHSVSATWRA